MPSGMPRPHLGRRSRRAKNGFEAFAIQPVAVDDGPILCQPKNPRPRVALLRARRHGSSLDEAETKSRDPAQRLAVFIKTRPPRPIGLGKAPAEDLHGERLIVACALCAYEAEAKRKHGKPMRSLRVKSAQGRGERGSEGGGHAAGNTARAVRRKRGSVALLTALSYTILQCGMNLTLRPAAARRCTGSHCAGMRDGRRQRKIGHAWSGWRIGLSPRPVRTGASGRRKLVSRGIEERSFVKRTLAPSPVALHSPKADPVRHCGQAGRPAHHH